MNIKEKLKKFSELCGDWDYRNIDMTNSHIQGINIEKDNLSITCELYSPTIDEYISCNGGTFNDMSLINKFKNLDLNNKEEVLDFISSLNNLVNWDKVDDNLYKEVEIEIKNINSVDDYDDTEAKIVSCKKLGEGWLWHKYDDGSGHLQSPDGKEYMLYDLCTNEYKVDKNSKHYDFFPLSYYYADGIEPSKFDTFDFMEQEMIDIVLPKEKETDKSLDESVNVLNVWKSDYDDYRANVEIGKGKILYGNVIASYDEDTIRDLTMNLEDPLSEKELKNAFAVLVASSFEDYINLPKISDVSPLLKEIYDIVCESDATMCHITKEDWADYYIDNYSEKDIEILEEEIKKYGLDEVIGIDEGEYKIIGYGDLETRFIDDSNLGKNSEYDFGM